MYVCVRYGAPKKWSTIFHFGYPCLCFVGKVKGLHRTCAQAMYTRKVKKLFRAMDAGAQYQSSGKDFAINHNVKNAKALVRHL